MKILINQKIMEPLPHSQGLTGKTNNKELHMTRRTHKKALIALTVALALAVPSLTLIARPARGGNGKYPGPNLGAIYYGHQPFRHLDRMQYYLGLSDQQVEKIFYIHQEYREKIFKNRKSFDTIQKLREEKHKAIEKGLTEDQKKKFNDWYKFKNRGRKYHRGPRCPGGGF